jgi:hypothetical protein
MQRFIKKLGEIQHRFPSGVEFRILVQRRSLLLTVVSKDVNGCDAIGTVRVLDRERAERSDEGLAATFEQMAQELDVSLIF